MKCPNGVAELRLRVPASLEAVEEICGEFRKCLAAVPDASAWFAAELIMREALNNSVLHGCGGNPDKQIECRVRVNSRRLIINVKDEGDGFDWRRVAGRKTVVSAVCGRGVSILFTYGTRVRFSNKGNAVTVVKHFQKATPD